VEQVAICSLFVADSPRISGENPEHLKALVVADGELPPIIVHHPTMRVIDGVHRLQAAGLRGEEKIAVRYFYGSEAEAFVLAVKSNITHGLPLSLADRESAAARIVGSHQQWSDRMIASVTGLAAKTVAGIRMRYTRNVAQHDARIGQDGRVRPVNGSAGRVLASELFTDDPNLSLRQVARAAGISPETARDVRNRLRQGEDPVQRRRSKVRADQGDGRGGHLTEIGARARLARAQSQDRAAVVERLKADPTLRFTETGRVLLRLLHMHAIQAEEWQKIGDNVPPHLSAIVTYLARQCAVRWKELAEQIERKTADMA